MRYPFAQIKLEVDKSIVLVKKNIQINHKQNVL